MPTRVDTNIKQFNWLQLERVGLVRFWVVRPGLWGCIGRRSRMVRLGGEGGHGHNALRFAKRRWSWKYIYAFVWGVFL